MSVDELCDGGFVLSLVLMVLIAVLVFGAALALLMAGRAIWGLACWVLR